MALKVSEVAKVARVSVRTLHHYDEIGLVRPSQRSEAGYRLYDEQDLQRLQQVLFFKALGFALEEVRSLLDAPDFDLKAALTLQKKLLNERADNIRGLLRAVDAALNALEEGRTMSTEEMFKGFDHTQYEAEASQRWGDTESFRESRRRTSKYTPEQWTALKQEADAIFKDLAALLDARVPATDARAMDVAERHRQHLERWFYPCPLTMHRELGELYVQDERFTQNMERIRAGLATYAREAWAANAERA